MPRGMFINTSKKTYSHWYILLPRCAWGLKYQAYRRGAFGVARFDRQGNSYEPQGVKRAIATELHVFFVSIR